jgi:DNA-binding NarL/FixJ family response regulator
VGSPRGMIAALMPAGEPTPAEPVKTNGHEPADAKTSVAECPLTDYQRAVLQWVANGKTNYQIAGIMGNTTEGAIEQHLYRILDRLGTSNRTGAIAIGFRAGWLK